MRLAAAALALLLASPALAADLSGRVVDVHDGDTLRLEDGTKIRLWGLDTPELKQTCDDAAGKRYRCGVRAREALQDLISSQPVTCERKGRSFDRVVARCEVAGKDLTAEMLRAGMGIEYRRFTKGAYAGDEQAARDARAGLWAGSFIEPAAWRKSRRAE